MFRTIARRPARFAAPLVGALALVASGAAVSGAQDADQATLSIRGGSVACDADEGTTTMVFKRADDAPDVTLHITGAEAEIEPGGAADPSIVELTFDPETLPPGTESAEAELTAPLGSTVTVTVTYEVSGAGISVPEEAEVQSVVTINDVCEPSTSTTAPTNTSTTMPVTTTSPSSAADTAPATPPASAEPLRARFTG